MVVARAKELNKEVEIMQWLLEEKEMEVVIATSNAHLEYEGLIKPRNYEDGKAGEEAHDWVQVPFK